MNQTMTPRGPRNQGLGGGSDQKGLQKRKCKKKNLKAMTMMMKTYLMYPCKKKKREQTVSKNQYLKNKTETGNKLGPTRGELTKN